MNRGEIRRIEREKLKQRTVFEKLTPVEQQLLINWANERMRSTWEKTEQRLVKVMRRNRISQKRIDEIFKQLREYTDKLFGEEK